MSDQTCATCKAGDFEVSLEASLIMPKKNGLCRRRIPFHIIEPTDWCLEWKPKARTFSAPRQGKHTLPDDWKPSEDCVLLAKSLGINAYSEAAKMRDHARYTKRMVADWDAAFRNWLRKGQR